MSSLRQQILTQAKIPSRIFTPDGFPCEVEVRGMNGDQRAEYVEFVSKAKAAGVEIFDLREFYPMLVLGHVYDPADGSRVFRQGRRPRPVRLCSGADRQGGTGTLWPRQGRGEEVPGRIERGERVYYHRLAERLGRTVDELLGSISSEELTDWITYDKLRAAEAEKQRQRPSWARGR